MDRSQPTHIEGHIIAKIIYAAVNAVDDSVRSGWLPARRSPAILGHEAVGIIVKDNDELSTGTSVIVSCFKVDGQIRGIYVDGVWQEYVVVKPEELIPISEHISDEQAAAFPVSFFSAQACLNKADFQPGKSILSLAVGGGVGNAGIQLAK